MPIVKKKAPVVGIPFLDMSTYAEGGQSFDFPEGDYAFQLRVDNEKFADGTVPIGCRLTGLPLRGGEAVEKFISFGKDMERSWIPTPDGMSIAENPEFPEDETRKPFSKKGNWAIFLKSIRDCDPAVPLNDSFEPIDGFWGHLQNIPEPTERAAYGQGTAEQSEKPKYPRKVPVITAILEGGKPWEGGGGFDLEAAPAKKVTPPVAKKPGIGTKKAVAPVEPEEEAEEETTDENEELDAATVADSAIAVILAKNKAGMSSAMLQTNVFSAVKKEHGDAMAQGVMKVMKGDGYEALLGMHQFALVGNMIKSAK